MAKVRIHDIAGLANVSIGTVDRALHGRKGIGENTRRRVLRIAGEMGYHPNLAARTLSVGHSEVRIGVCVPRELHFFFDQVLQGIAMESRRYEGLGIEVVYRLIKRLGDPEFEEVKDLLASNIRALIVAPGDPKQLVPLINEAELKGIRVICVVSDAPASKRSTVVCVDPELNGRLAGELMGKLLPRRSQVVIVTGMLQMEDHRRKVQGFSEIFPKFCAGGKVLEVIEGHDDDDETFTKCFGSFRSHRSIQGVYVSTASCLPVCRALSVLGLGGKTKLITTDLYREMVPYIERGMISASIYQSPYIQGRDAVRLCVDHILDNRPIPPFHYLNPAVVMCSNLRLFRESREKELSEGTIPDSRSRYAV